MHLSRDIRHCVQALAIVVCTAGVATAQSASPVVDGLSRYQVEAICGPTTPSSGAIVARIAGARDNANQRQYGPHDRLVVDGGSSSGLTVGQQFTVRRRFPVADPRKAERVETPGEHAAGWLRLVRVEADWSEAEVVHQCGEFVVGDGLLPFETPTVLSDPSGAPQFDAAAEVVFGDEGRTVGGATQLMVIDRGSQEQLHIGQRVTIFRRVFGENGPISPLGEATIVSIAEHSATIRLDGSRDAIQVGDQAAPHATR